MRLCLFHLPDVYSHSFVLHETQSRLVGKLPPYTLMVVAAAAERAGHAVRIVDCNLDALGPREALVRASDWSAGVLGFSLNTYNLATHLGFIREMKKKTRLPVIAGGRHLGYYPRETMSHDEIDHGVVGEADSTIGELLDALAGARSLDSVDGILYRREGDVRMTAPRQIVADLDTLPLPARHLVENERYYNIVSSGGGLTLAMVSRGCPHRCSFCDMGAGRFRRRSVGSVVEEIRVCTDRFGIRTIDIQDSTFNASPSYTKDLCREIIRTRCRIRFAARAHVSGLDEEMAKLLKEAGCHLLMFGVESGNQAVLDETRKGITLEEVREAIRMTRRAGIATMGYFIFGLPGETRETARQTIDFSLSLDLDYAQFTRLVPMPNTRIYEDACRQAGGTDFWRAHTLQPTVEYAVPVPGCLLTNEEAARFMDLAYRRFYLRGSRLVAQLTRVRSPLELFRLARAGMSLVRGRVPKSRRAGLSAERGGR